MQSGQTINVNKLIETFVDDLNALFDVENIAYSRTISNIHTASNTLNSLSSLLQRVHVSVVDTFVIRFLAHFLEHGY